MKNVYLIYIKVDNDSFNTLKYIIPNVHDYIWRDEKFYGMYAWTSSKSKLSDFLETREEKVFVTSKKELDSDEFELFKEHFYTLELNRYKYNTIRLDKKETVEVVSTKNEYIEVVENGSENYQEFGPTVSDRFNYKIFNKDIIKALDILGYTEVYDLNYGTYDDSVLADYNKSFGLTPLGNIISTTPSALSLLIYLFYYTFYGKMPYSKERKD